MTDLPTWEELDLLVDTDPIKLRDVAWELVKQLETHNRRLRMIQGVAQRKGEH